MPASQIEVAFRGETDAYDTTRERLLGRHSAGLGVLQAAISTAMAEGAPIAGYGPATNMDAFAAIAQRIDQRVGVLWAPIDDPGALARVSTLYLGDATMSVPARLRLRSGIAAFSLCGVTHTTASKATMNEIVGLLREPVATWDALICTSTAVVETVRVVHEAETEYLRWRFGKDVTIACPQLPLIPLGVHTDSFSFSDEDRTEARATLGVAPDEVVVLYVGRYSAHGKAHPLAMFQGLEAAAKRSGQKIVAILCGWPTSPQADEMFRDAAGQFAPGVRTLFTDGRKVDEFRRSWAAADIFLSLVDGVQETFGLTPIEAKAAGLPVICTDWNGYRDTVREGVDGFRIRTWAPVPGMGEPIRRAFEAETMKYDHYAWVTSSSTAVDMDQLVERLADLAANPDLRRAMGAAGRQDARARFEWTQIYATYRDLWRDLADRRRAALNSEHELGWITRAPRVNPAHLDPFLAFAHYPTEHIGPDSVVSRSQAAAREMVTGLAGHRLFARHVVPLASLLAAWDALEEPRAVSVLAALCDTSVPPMVRAVGLLAKMGLVRLG